MIRLYQWLERLRILSARQLGAARMLLLFRFLCFYFPVTPRIPLTYFVVICQQEAFLAAEKGQIHKVQSYLIQDHNPNSANEFGDTLLHIAVRHGHKVASNLQHAIRFQALTQWVMLQADGGDASGAWRRRAALTFWDSAVQEQHAGHAAARVHEGQLPGRSLPMLVRLRYEAMAMRGTVRDTPRNAPHRTSLKRARSGQAISMLLLRHVKAAKKAKAAAKNSSSSSSSSSAAARGALVDITNTTQTQTQTPAQAEHGSSSSGRVPSGTAASCAGGAGGGAGGEGAGMGGSAACGNCGVAVPKANL
eukprot:807138-Rhodomonas_salina.4